MGRAGQGEGREDLEGFHPDACGREGEVNLLTQFFFTLYHYLAYREGWNESKKMTKRMKELNEILDLPLVQPVKAHAVINYLSTWMDES